MMKSVLITGASSGIGAELALILARQGHNLILTARRDHLLRELTTRCESEGAGSVKFIVGDVCAVAANPKLIDFMRSDGEPVLVNNAGMAQFGSYAETSWEQHESQIQTNLLGTMKITHAVLPTMLAAGSGQIINVLSVAAKHVFSGAAVYSATKAGILQFGNSLREEYRKSGIRVTNIIPGATNTPLWDGQGFSPPTEKMLSAVSVAHTIADIIALPADRMVEELTITPPDGIL